MIDIAVRIILGSINCKSISFLFGKNRNIYGKLISSLENEKALSPFYHKKIFLMEKECKTPISCIFYQKYLLYDKMAPGFLFLCNYLQ